MILGFFAKEDLLCMNSKAINFSVKNIRAYFFLIKKYCAELLRDNVD